MKTPGSPPSFTKLHLLLAALKLGCTGFGGGMAVLSMMRREFVEKRKVCDEECFLNAAALSQALPGAISFNAMSFLGLSMHGFWGATIASWGFMLPSFLMMIGLSISYESIVHMEGASRMMHGLVAGVVGIIAAVAWELAKQGTTRCRRGWIIVALSFLGTLLGVGVVEIVLGCGVAGMFLCSADNAGHGDGPTCTRGVAPFAWSMKSFTPLFLGAGGLMVLWPLGLLFLRVGLVTFGGGYVMIPMIQHEVVDGHHWLSAKEFADGMALGQLTPGPVVITATFVGYKVAGLLGAWVASTAVFVPSFILSLVFGYSLDRWRKNAGIAAFMSGVQPAVVGLMAGAAIVLGRAGFLHWTTLAAAALCALVLIRFRPSPVLIILATATAGLFLPSQ